MTPAGMCMNYSHTCRLDPLVGRVIDRMRKVYVLISSSSTAGIVGAY